ncbi:MAG TPA: class I SAM-dependent methyltransferase [Solirubrobacterales bacterium]|nr:class I SAM-dependent methyltransferase [Solirubrobacterales bacterium]
MRAQLLAAATGRTLEIGGGTGANIGHYTQAVTELVVTEPDPHMARRLRTHVADASTAFPVEVVEAPAESLPFADASFDCVVSALVLCTVSDPERAAAEVRRVLAPSGRLLLIEHIRDPHSERRARWQDRLERPWGWFVGGCHPNRDTTATLAAAGFELDLVDDEFPKSGPVIKPLVRGTATLS